MGLFDEHFLLERLTKLEGPLVKLEEHIDWQLFAPILNGAFTKPLNRKNMGRQPFDRLSFKRFLGLKCSDKVPDSITIWKFRETLIQEEVIEALFFRFNQALDDQCIFAKK